MTALGGMQVIARSLTPLGWVAGLVAAAVGAGLVFGGLGLR